jgi:hypothetical protein
MKEAPGLYADSLEMLLDTMCNMLGGVIFIALMVALLAQKTPPPTTQDYEKQSAELSNELADVNRSNAWLQTQIAQMSEHLQQTPQQLRTNQMRLPMTAQTTKTPWHVIVRYGKLYPLFFVSSTSRDGTERNTRTLASGRTITPLLDSGDEPELGVTNIVDSLRQHGRTNVFLAFWVYEDSFPAFNRAKETTADLGFQYGWEPVARDRPLMQSQRGQTISPQN